jgi:hypothetical protein
MVKPDDTRTWGEKNFGAARLGDKRRTRSLVDLADRVLAHPRGSLPEKFSDPNALLRCYRLMNSPHVTHQAVLEPHRQLTLDKVRQRQGGVVLFLSDVTELDFSGKLSLHEYLGQLSCSRQRGYLCLNVLAVDPTTREAIGLVNQILHLRPEVPDDETQTQKRQRQNRESRLWLTAVTDLPAAPPDSLWVDVIDAAADTFEFEDFEDLRGRKYVVRSAQDRRIVIGHQEQRLRRLDDSPPLLGHVRGLPAAASRVLQVPARDGHAARETVVSVSFAAVQLRPPMDRRGEYRNAPVAVWVVRVWEENPPAGQEAIEWVLLTNVEVQTLEQAWQIADWYGCRWVVEELHKGQKTGCSIEAPQFTTVEAMQPMIALLSVVAVALLNLRDMSRREETKDRPAEEVVSAEYVEVLSAWRYAEVRALSVREFYLALARLGGHLNRRKDHPPGWIVLWRGWMKLQLLCEGARLAKERDSSRA